MGLGLWVLLISVLNANGEACDNIKQIFRLFGEDLNCECRLMFGLWLCVGSAFGFSIQVLLRLVRVMLEVPFVSL